MENISGRNLWLDNNKLLETGFKITVDGPTVAILKEVTQFFQLDPLSSQFKNYVLYFRLWMTLLIWRSSPQLRNEIFSVNGGGYVTSFLDKIQYTGM